MSRKGEPRTWWCCDVHWNRTTSVPKSVPRGQMALTIKLTSKRTISHRRSFHFHLPVPPSLFAALAFFEMPTFSHGGQSRAQQIAFWSPMRYSMAVTITKKDGRTKIRTHTLCSKGIRPLDPAAPNDIINSLYLLLISWHVLQIQNGINKITRMKLVRH